MKTKERKERKKKTFLFAEIHDFSPKKYIQFKIWNQYSENLNPAHKGFRKIFQKKAINILEDFWSKNATPKQNSDSF